MFKVSPRCALGSHYILEQFGVPNKSKRVTENGKYSRKNLEKVGEVEPSAHYKFTAGV